MLDRKTAPAFKTIEGFEIPLLSKSVLPNGIPLYHYNGGSSEVLKLEIYLEHGGQVCETKPGQSNISVKMLTEGTSKISAEEIQKQIAQYGGFIELNPGSDRSSIVIYSLSRYLGKLLPILQDILTDSIFPDKELGNLKNITIQGLKVNLEKTGYLASSKFREMIFGERHPYGFNLSIEAVEAIDRQDLLTFYSKSKFGNYSIFLSGNFDNQSIHDISNTLGQLKTITQSEVVVPSEIRASKERRVVVEKSDNMQCSLRVGRRLFSSTHPDYFSFVVANEILGGYFGSRLMQNLREDKGLTYGVHANVVGYKTDGYFVIGTDVKKSDAQLAIDEIMKEIGRMRTEPVGLDELETVRNYMLGSFVNTLTTPFAITDKTKSMILNNLPENFYQNYFKTVQEITPEKIMEVSTKYWKQEDLVEVIGGSLE